MRRLEIAVLIILKLAAIACTAYGELPPGTVLVSKNIDPALNTSIGDANHVAIVALDGSIIESQEGKGVQKITLAEYQARPYSPPQAMTPCALETGRKAAAKAESLVGLPFRKFSSVFRRQGELRRTLGLNCVSVFKVAYWEESRQVRRVKTPDDVLQVGAGLLDAPRPLADLLKPPAAPAIPPTEHSVLVTPKSRRWWDGTLTVDLGFGNYLRRNVYDDPWPIKWVPSECRPGDIESFE
jgi:hypothetical protein